MLTRYRIIVSGVVQGVGFRPFIKRLADRLGICGTVMNTAAGVVIEIDTVTSSRAEEFVAAIRAEVPTIARIENLEITPLGKVEGHSSFMITASDPNIQSFTLISADIAVCADCLREIGDPDDRRYGYPFTNCTNCGPRYSITTAVPYDRANTTMAPFGMCPQCLLEYRDPENRRFHAEPNACPLCGPHLEVDLSAVIAALQEGKIVAIKGLGGFQLACDAHSEAAVERLRAMKRRSRKPFAVMMRDTETVAQHCDVNRCELDLLGSRTAPIVLLNMRQAATLAPGLAPGLRELGVMLPYTPLHHLLFRDGLDCVVMTSGNISEEPIVISNEEAHRKLAPLSDVVVTHDREIFMRVDDSVVRVLDDTPRVLRRARGYAPEAIDLGCEAHEVLACGGELKNTFCLTKGHYAIVSQHIGDMENLDTLEFFEETLRNLKQVYRAAPRLIAHDLHPGYMTTRWAAAQPEPKITVQHHHAHIASCMAENGVREKVIGIAFDGTGYGSDGQIWGGEFLICDYAGFERAAHLRYVPLIGGDRAVREGYRMAAAHLHDAFGSAYRDRDLPVWNAASASTWKIFDRLLERPSLLTSSCGRLFDAVSALAGVCQSSGYEGEAAMLLENAAENSGAGSDGEQYPFPMEQGSFPWVIDTRPMIRCVAGDVARGCTPAQTSACFHDSIANMMETVCLGLRERTGIEKVCLSGGTFQNFTLLCGALDRLGRRGFQVFTHAKVPPNDGGLSLGQAVVAATTLQHHLEAKHEVP
ncbi:MAG: carbamoyltransferase HypF [Acidobacteriota bacterium]|nr:carbamoyltransferase HypF [Acidobacteriota bacterium]